jgi:hypothetical protein
MFTQASVNLLLDNPIIQAYDIMSGRHGNYGLVTFGTRATGATPNNCWYTTFCLKKILELKLS